MRGNAVLKIWVTESNTKSVQQALQNIGWWWNTKLSQPHTWCVDRWIVCYESKQIAHSQSQHVGVPEFIVPEEVRDE